MSKKQPSPAKATVVDQLLLRDQLGLQRYRKGIPRDPEERRILLQLALARMEKAERENFLPRGFRRRRVFCCRGICS